MTRRKSIKMDWLGLERALRKELREFKATDGDASQAAIQKLVNIDDIIGAFTGRGRELYDGNHLELPEPTVDYWEEQYK